MSLAAAEQAVREGQLDAALRHLQDQVRARPGDAPLRVFLFQLLCVLGQWERAATQLDVVSEMDASTLAMAQMYRETIRCEALRRDVFAGTRSPLVFGEPDMWLALLIEALSATGDPAAELRQRAFDAAPASPGRIDGRPFAWIADADTRIGPVCEAIVNGRYYWIPFTRLSRITLEAPADLRDFVWMPAHFQFANGGEAAGVIPTRYPGTERSDDPQLRLGRKTVWGESGGEAFAGLGQRLFATDDGEFALMDVRSIEIDAIGDDAAEA
jgi:type VI secretion system protein ImpE